MLLCGTVVKVYAYRGVSPDGRNLRQEHNTGEDGKKDGFKQE